MQQKFLVHLKYYLLIITSACLIIIACSKSLRLVSIEITPVNAHVSIGNTRQFTALGHYADGSTKNITSHVIWKSSSASIAKISSSGVATGVAVGIVNITGTVLYVANEGNSTVSACLLNKDGTINGSCSITGMTTPGGVNVNPDGNYLYISNLGAGTVSYCPINSDGTLSNSCSNTLMEFDGPDGIAIY